MFGIAVGIIVFETLVIGILLYVLCGKNKDVKSQSIFADMIMANTNDYIFIKDKDFKIVQANDNFLKLYPEGDRDKIIGYTTVEKFTKSDANEFLKEDKIAFDFGYSKKIETVTLPTGQKATLSTRKIRFYNEHQIPFILGIATDITQTENLTYENDRLNHLFNLLLNLAPDMAFVKNEKLEIIYANDAFLNGFTKDVRKTVINNTAHLSLPDDTIKALRMTDDESLSTGMGTYEGLLTLQNGKRIDAVLRKQKIVTTSGEVYIFCTLAEK